MLNADGGSFLAENSRLSEERNDPPRAARMAPPVADELSHPRPRPLGGFAHGHAAVPPTPGSQSKLKLGPPRRSRTKTSHAPLVSPGTRSEAALENRTYRASGDSYKYKPALGPFP